MVKGRDDIRTEHVHMYAREAVRILSLPIMHLKAFIKQNTMKLTTIERFFPASFHEISAPKSHVLYQSYVKSL
jgi:hypothetical protein